MALARVKVWNAGDTLTAADLNAEYNNILNNPTSLINLSAAGDLAIVSSAAAVTRLAIGTAAQSLVVSSGLLPAWSAPILQSYLSGCQITTITQTSSGTITHSSGVAVDSTSNSVAMVLSSALIGTTTGAFVAGNNQPKLQVSPLAASTSYHIYVISSALGGSTDVLYSSSTSPTLPTGYAKSRRVGTFLTGSTGNILAMTQDGDYFQLAASILDVNVTNPGSGAVTRTLTVPPGVSVGAITIVGTAAPAGAGLVSYVVLSDLAANDEAATNSHSQANAIQGSAMLTQTQVVIRTNASAQIRSRESSGDASAGTVIRTLGWWDTRGKVS